MKPATRLGIGIVMVGVSVGVGMRAIKQHEAEAEAKAPWGRFTAAEITAQASQRCLALIAPNASATWTASPYLASHKAGDCRVWTVDASERRPDCSEEKIVHTLWNADTGEVYGISQDSMLDRPRTDPIETAHEAELTAAYWLQELHLTDSAHPWKRIGTPRHIDHVWRIALRQGERKASLDIEDRDRAFREFRYTTFGPTQPLPTLTKTASEQKGGEPPLAAITGI